MREVLFVHHDGGVKLDGVCTFDSIPGCETTVTTCPSDSLFDQQWSLVNWGQTTGTCDADIDVDAAWELATGSVGVKIGIFDEGIEGGQEDVAGKVSGELFPVESLLEFHGTFVACIAAANTNNSKGIAGVDHKARLVSIMLPGSTTSANDTTIVRKVQEAAIDSLHILNCSWALQYGTPSSSGPIGRFSHCVRAAFRDYYMCNGVAVASMGNCGTGQPPSSCGDAPSPIQYPAGFGQGIIAVGSTDHDDIRPEDSSVGNHIDVVAPGVAILSCWPNQYLESGWYAKSSGTSFAAPHVAGVAGLLFSYSLNDSLHAELGIMMPPLYNDDVEQLIRISAEDLGPIAGFDSLSGMGRMNAGAALDLLQVPNRLYNDEVALGGTLRASDWQGEVCFLYPPQGVEQGWYDAFRHPVETVVTFPRTFASPPHVWGRGVATVGYSTDGSDSGFDNVNFGIGWCGAVGTITASSCTLRTYVYSLRDSTGAHIAWAPTDAGNVKYAYSVLGELEPTDVRDFAVGDAAGLMPRITSANPQSDGRLRVWLPRPAGMRLEIYDVKGRLVRLVHQGQMAAGGHEFTWDGLTASGRRASSGLYFARLQTDDRVLSHKLVVLR